MQYQENSLFKQLEKYDNSLGPVRIYSQLKRLTSKESKLPIFKNFLM